MYTITKILCTYCSNILLGFNVKEWKQILWPSLIVHSLPFLYIYTHMRPSGESLRIIWPCCGLKLVSPVLTYKVNPNVRFLLTDEIETRNQVGVTGWDEKRALPCETWTKLTHKPSRWKVIRENLKKKLKNGDAKLLGGSNMTGTNCV